ncbi:MAG: oligosaccharide flippase family protein [Oscillospiraceae bacterium]
MKSNSRIALKAGLWYIIGNFASKAAVFLTTPIFARLLSQEDYGSFSNFTSWLTILTVIVTWNLYSSMNNARYAFDKNLDDYIASILVFGTGVTLVFYFLFFIFQEPLLSLFGMKQQYVHFIFVYLLVSPAFEIVQAKYRVLFKYKLAITLAFAKILLSVLLSLLLVICFENQLDGRIIGYLIPGFVINVILYVIAIRKRHFSFKYIKYAVALSIPLAVHILAKDILASSDKIMITNICGSVYTAKYSLAYSLTSIVMILVQSVNQAWQPWLFENLKNKSFENIKKATLIYMGTFAIAAIGIALISPELILLLGGNKYADVKWIVPSLITGCIFQVAYGFYVNIEQFERKVKGIAFGTIIAAAANIILNIFLIPKFGYLASAYTTLVGYVILYVIHYAIVSKMGKVQIYSNKIILIELLLTSIILHLVLLTYNNNRLRWGIIVIYFIAIMVFGLKLWKEKTHEKN